MAKIVSFCSQKGGVGKTSITTHVATYYSQVEQVPVAVFDCDFPQHSLNSIRLAEIDRLKADESFMKKAERLTKPYPIYSGTLVDTLPRLDAYKTKNELVFVDLPGTLNVDGFAGMVKRMDVAILLLEADPISFESTMHTVAAMANVENKNGGMVPTYLLWNKYNVHERAERYSNLEQAALNYLNGLNVGRVTPMTVRFINYRIPQSVNIKDHRSTLFPHRTIEPLIQELNKIFVSNSTTV